MSETKEGPINDEKPVKVSMVNRRLGIVDIDRCVGCQNCMFACSRRAGKAGLDKSCIGVKSVGGMERGFVVVVCRACEDPPCQKVCPVDAIEVREQGGVKIDLDKCIGCKKCSDSCPLGAIFWDEETNKPLVCNYCGYCAQFCPHNVLKLEKTDKKDNKEAEKVAAG